MKIGNVNLDEEVLIIAEIGNNHEGNLDTAKKMITQAAEAGVSAVKFQTIVPERLVSSSDEKRLKQLKRFQFSKEQFKELADCAEQCGVIFLSTPFDVESVEFLNEFVPAFKIASGDNTFYPLLEAVAKTGKPILISSGLADEQELKSSIACIEACWEKVGYKGDLIVLHCVSNYPVAPENANLLAIQYLKDSLNHIVGYSDHTLGVEASLAAVAMGARVIEKHFTIDKNFSDFRDHQLSADAQEMKVLVEKAKVINQMRGRYTKAASDAEQEVKPLLRRSIAAKNDLPAGHAIQEDDIIWVRPGTGILAGEEEKVVGKKIKKDVAAGELITADTLE